MSDKPENTDIAANTVAHNGDLRDRIAEAIQQSIREQMMTVSYEWISSRTLADAVIDALGLRKQSQTGEIVNVIEGDGINYGRHRYVTEWEDDDES